jgi:hypothetical protein
MSIKSNLQTLENTRLMKLIGKRDALKLYRALPLICKPLIVARHNLETKRKRKGLLTKGALDAIYEEAKKDEDNWLGLVHWEGIYSQANILYSSCTIALNEVLSHTYILKGYAYQYRLGVLAQNVVAADGIDEILHHFGESELKVNIIKEPKQKIHVEGLSHLKNNMSKQLSLARSMLQVLQTIDLVTFTDLGALVDTRAQLIVKEINSVNIELLRAKELSEIKELNAPQLAIDPFSLNIKANAKDTKQAVEAIERATGGYTLDLIAMIVSLQAIAMLLRDGAPNEYTVIERAYLDGAKISFIGRDPDSFDLEKINDNPKLEGELRALIEWVEIVERYNKAYLAEFVSPHELLNE